MGSVTKSDQKKVQGIAQIKPLTKLRGRPPIGRGTQVNIVMRPELIRTLDSYCIATGKNRSSAIRYLLRVEFARLKQSGKM